tara:strand:+ start:2128 stop:2709 length:582 start_codon:yes stop_codon:yes gene_type:complete
MAEQTTFLKLSNEEVYTLTHAKEILDMIFKDAYQKQIETGVITSKTIEDESKTAIETEYKTLEQITNQIKDGIDCIIKDYEISYATLTSGEQTVFDRAYHMLYTECGLYYMPELQRKFIFYGDYLSKFDNEQYDSQFVRVKVKYFIDHRHTTEDPNKIKYVSVYKTFNIRTFIGKLKQKLSYMHEINQMFPPQ